MAATRRSTVFDNVDPGLSRAIEEVSRGYKPYRAEAFSGNRPRPRNPSSLHPQGNALDVNLYDTKTGALLPNIGDPASATAYQGFANEVYKWAVQNDPELAKQLVWGGYFAGGSWPQDYMHFQRGGNTPQGGSWAGGFTPDVMKKLGLSSAGGIEAMDAQMKAAGYTPEQRRNAIASMESRGMGDYGAVGREADPAGHKARGRYQVMDYNIEPWAKEYLKKEGVTVDQFMADPQLQDQLFDAVYGDYVNKYGERGAASKWFTGSENEPNVTDVNGKLTGKTYADRYMAALEGAPAGHPTTTVGTGGYTTPGANTTQVPSDSPPVANAPHKTNAWEALADAGMNMKAAPWKQPQIDPTPGAARIDQAATPLFDPAKQQQRQQLAQMMLARLNQGTLV